MRVTRRMRWVTQVMQAGLAGATLVLAGVGPGVARAQAREAAAAAHPVRGAVHVSMDQAVRLVEARFKARVVRADIRRQDGQVIYVMRLLDRHGRVFTVQVDASSGRIR